MRAFCIAVNEHGEDCGHRHKWLMRAIECSRHQERYYRRKYGERQVWTSHRVTYENGKLKVAPALGEPVEAALREAA